VNTELKISQIACVKIRKEYTKNGQNTERKQTHEEDGKVNSTDSCTTTVQRTLQTMAKER